MTTIAVGNPTHPCQPQAQAARTNQTWAAPRYRWRLTARWLLLGAVIAGVMAMHILGGHDSGGAGQPMAMTSAGPAMPAPIMPMAMPSPGRASQDPTGHPADGSHLQPAPGSGMSDMSCCVLFLVTVVGLVLLMRLHAIRSRTHTDRALGRTAPWAAPGRGPPGAGRPRITLSILRV